jgi:hypothetical protein
MSKQTAVEWLVEQMINQLDIRIENITTGIELFDQAKAMEQEQILTAYMTAKLKHVDCLGIDVMKRKVINETQQYYNQTYGGEE